MGLKIMLGRDGKPRGNWYGRFMVRGRSREVNLGVAVEGETPMGANGRPLLSAKGDAAFERSRKAAAHALAALRREARRDPADLAAKAYRARTGETAEGVPLSRLASKWAARKRSYTPCEKAETDARLAFEAFAAFASKWAAGRGVKCECVNDITPDCAAAWFEELRGRFAWGTVKTKMGFLRAACGLWATGGRPNPFDGIIVRSREAGNARISRRPLTTAELARLFEASEADALVHPLIVCAACTGMRLGDCCRLRWEAVDLHAGLIEVTTAKTGKRVSIPLFGRLRRVLEERAAVEGDGSKPSPLVFPEAAALYAQNGQLVSYRARPYFGLAVGDWQGEAEKRAAQEAEIAKGARTVEGEIMAAQGIGEAVRGRIAEAFRRAAAGESRPDIARALGVHEVSVSNYLAAARRIGGEAAARAVPRISHGRRTRRFEGGATLAELTRRTRQTRAAGIKSASVYGFHSLRATFVVLAVEAGVPLPDVQKIVGHATADMTLQYFNPTSRHAAERVARQMRGSILDGGAAAEAAPRALPMDATRAGGPASAAARGGETSITLDAATVAGLEARAREGGFASVRDLLAAFASARGDGRTDARCADFAAVRGLFAESQNTPRKHARSLV